MGLYTQPHTHALRVGWSRHHCALPRVFVCVNENSAGIHLSQPTSPFTLRERLITNRTGTVQYCTGTGCGLEVVDRLGVSIGACDVLRVLPVCRMIVCVSVGRYVWF